MTYGKIPLVLAGAFCALATPAFGVPTFFILQRDTRTVQTGPSTLACDGFTLLLAANYCALAMLSVSLKSGLAGGYEAVAVVAVARWA
jgi:hypothetical protein